MTAKAGPDKLLLKSIRRERVERHHGQVIWNHLGERRGPAPVLRLEESRCDCNRGDPSPGKRLKIEPHHVSPRIILTWRSIKQGLMRKPEGIGGADCFQCETK